MTALIVVAHPDDEVLGCGGTAAALAANSATVYTCILSGRVDAREHRPEIPELLENITTTHRVLGLTAPLLGDFPNIKFNAVPHLELVQFIEKVLLQTGATTVFTHHPGDLNDDHRQTSLACQAAVRLFQRRTDVRPLQALFFMEILSSTDWAFPGTGDRFQADTFFELGEELLAKKIDALRAYHGVMRDFPHPRSEEILRSLAAFRGGQAGMRYAEAFQTAFRALKATDFGGR